MSQDPTIVQQLPTAPIDNTDVGRVVYERVSKLFSEEVANDHEARIAFGEKKYGQRLKINNGRSALMDSYQELLDALSYLMQGNLEGNYGCLPIFDETARLAVRIRRMLDKESK